MTEEKLTRKRRSPIKLTKKEKEKKERLLFLTEQLRAKKQLLKQKRQLLVESQNKIKEFAYENKLLFFNNMDYQWLGARGVWKENPIQSQFFSALKNSIFKVYALTGANRISKTFSTSGILAATALRGRFPWENPETTPPWFWEIRNWELPISIRIVGQDWEKHIKATIVATLKELIPKSWGIITKKNNVGVDATWTDPETNSFIEIMSNKSESDVFEGARRHIVIYDEPPKRDVRIACARGLIDFNGIEVFAMTLLKEAWVEQEVINATLSSGEPDESIWSIIGDIQDNVGFGLTQEGVDQFAKTLTEDEKSARLRGIPAYKSGLVWAIDRNKHIINQDIQNLPAHYIVDISIDYHPGKPQYVLFLATSESNHKFVCYELVFNGDGSIIADKIIKAIKLYKLRVGEIIADPLAKSGSANFIETEYDKIADGLARFGYSVSSAARFKPLKEDGIMKIESLLKTANNLIQLYFFRGCHIAIKQCCNWMYDDKHEPAKKEDDMCENLYRLGLLDTQYFEPKESEPLEYVQNKRVSSVTGY